MTGLRGRVGIAAGALMIMAIGGLAVPAATVTPAAAATQQVPGIDALSPNPTSWADVTAAGKAFVGVEAAQGATITNANYASVVQGATAAGLYVMPYVFADPAKVDGAGQFSKAWAVISNVSGVPYTRGGLMLPVALDMETDQINFPSEPCYGLSVSAMISWIQAFIDAARAQTGAIPVLYSNPNWWKLCTNNTTVFGGAPLWIANYGVSSPTIPPGWSGYTFWQSSSSGTVAGTAVDLDQMQGAPSAVFATAGSSGQLQIQTLNGLAGQAVTYSGAGLNTGMSVSPSGLFGWTSATPVGSYPVTVTPSASSSSAVFPSAVSFTFDVHGTITVLSPGDRTTAAGSPVYLRIATSGPDQNAGFKPIFAASGLPTGLSMSSSGQITGWPSRPGTFKVTVSAKDALHGAGSMSFTWAIKAATGGVAGAVRQVGGSAKCLNDPNSSTANGTLVNLWTCTGKSNQVWTVVQDGTIRVLGRCLDVAGESKSNGAKLQLWSCNSGDGAQQWQAGTGGELVNPQSGRCLYVPVSSAANGTRPVLWGCANVANDHWSRPAASIYSGVPGKCMTISGSTVTQAGCANVAAQHWTASADGTFRLGGKCLTESGTGTGTGLFIGSCSGAAATKWKLAAVGPIAVRIASAASGHCVTFPPGGTARLLMEACTTGPASTWHIM